MDLEKNSSSRWNFTKGVVFRFLFSYLVLCIWPFPLYFIPFSGYVLQPIQGFFEQITDAVGPLLLGKYYMHSSMIASSDTSYRYAQTFVSLMLATTSTLIWSIIDRRRWTYEKLSVGLNVLVRYYLAAALLNYGFLKVIPLQFPAPTVARLTETYGDSSRMGLLWTFMGASPAYTIFTGIGEVVGGTLLLFKRTRLLGAVISAFVLTHVFVLNLSYDVPVKLYSFHLLFMSLFLVASDAQRLANLFLLNKPIAPEIPLAQVADTRLRWLGIIAKTGLICLIFFQPLYSAIEQKQEQESKAAATKRDDVAGEFEVSYFILNHDTLPALETETRRWKNVRLGGNSMQITYMDGLSIPWLCSIRNGSKKIKVLSKDLSTSGEFRFERQGEWLSLHGTLNQDSLRIVSRYTPKNAFLLYREFHWISEEPFYH
jgi:uncharacterized membrane protein YphA (DoxX/SURF4 family)